MKNQLVVIEADRHAYAYLSDLLAYFSFTPTHCLNFEEAFECLRNGSYLALMVDDGCLAGELTPVMDRLSDMDRQLPVIVMSQMADHELWARYLDQGATDLLRKPLEPGALRRALKMVEPPHAGRPPSSDRQHAGDADESSASLSRRSAPSDP